MSVSRGWTDAQRERVLEWLRANDIDPNNIPDDSPLNVAGGKLTTDVFRRNAAGKIQLDSSGDGAAREVATFTVSIPPPADVAQLIRGRRA